MMKKLIISLLVIFLVGVLATGCALGGQPIGWSGGVVADGALFWGSMEGKLVAIDVSSYNHLWPDVPLEAAKPAASFGCAAPSASVAIYGTPAVSEDLVYVAGYSGKLQAFKVGNGTQKWMYPPGEDDYLQPIVGGPVVAQGKVYFGCADGKVYALDADTGASEWEFENGDKIWSTPVIDGDTLYIGSFDKKLYALDAAEGKKKWEFETKGAIASTPVVYNKAIYIGSFDRHLYALNATNGEPIWQFPVEDEAENKPENWFWAKPVVYNNTIYAGNLDGKVYILNAENGNEVAAAIDLNSPISSSPVLIGNTVIIATEVGRVYSIDTSTNQVKPIVGLEEEIRAPLSGSEGVVYIHTQEGILYEVEAQTGAKRQLYSAE